MRLFTSLLIVCLTTSFLMAEPIPKIMKMVTKPSIVGNWSNTPGTNSGWVFRADGTAGAGTFNNPGCKALYKVDTTQEPAHIDWSQDGGNTWYLGCYKIDGDNLQISFGSSSAGVRPQSVDKNNGHQFVSAFKEKK